MGFCICNRSTFLIRSWEANQQHVPFNQVTETVIEVATLPDFRAQRWDGASGLRAATAQELADFDTAKLDSEAQVRIDDKVLKAVLLFLVQRLNELRTQPTTVFGSLTPQEVRASIIAIYKGL